MQSPNRSASSRDQISCLRQLSFAAALIAGVSCGAGQARATELAPAVVYNFTTMDDKLANADRKFNQLLGINAQGIICGYQGDGAILPNKGYVLVPFDHYSDENFPLSAQTQVVGINNNKFPTTVGFFIDTAGNNFGFSNINGVFTKVKNPHSMLNDGVFVDQLLGVNDNGMAVGFYLGANGRSFGFQYDTATRAFGAINLNNTAVTSFFAAGINNTNMIAGTVTLSGGATQGFFGTSAPFTYVSLNGTGYSNPVFFGINNNGIAVGTATKNGVTHGLVFDTNTLTASIVDDPLQSATPAFGITGTTINGINDHGDLVGFYSDGSRIHGFLAQHP